jgi:hypothetical protein
MAEKPGFKNKLTSNKKLKGLRIEALFYFGD